MKIVESSGKCACCHANVDFSLGEETHSLKKKDLDNYKQYKDIYISYCPMCEYVALDITSRKDCESYNNIVNTKEFKDIYFYRYLKGLDSELYDNHSSDIPANQYEAMALEKLVQKDYETAVRLLYKTIELKIIMARKYRISKDELGGEEGNDDDYDRLDKLITQSINENRKLINIIYSIAKNKNAFLTLLYIENLANSCNIAEAKREYAILCDKVNLTDDLKNYIESKIVL